MKSLVALAIVAVGGVVGFQLSGPVFDAAAWDLCSNYAESQGWELLEASGNLGYQRKRPPYTPKSSDYWCRFEAQSGESIFLDQMDQVMPVTARSRWLRLGGWMAMVTPVIGGLVLAGWSGLLRRSD